MRESFDVLDAPHKELVVFEHPAHLPFLAEPAKFTEQVVRAGAAAGTRAARR
jgi:pimeloyl-ACP methyl ester carboxylesterase